MSHTAPIERKALAAKGLFNEESFFQLLAEENNFGDPKSMKVFYLGLVRVITAELRKNGAVRLPHLGDFALVKQKDGARLAGKFRIFQTGTYMLKFYANDTWKKYFAKYNKQPEKAGRIDPREKIFGVTLE